MSFVPTAGDRAGSCRGCGRPFRPTHDVDSPGPTSRHPFMPVHPFDDRPGIPCDPDPSDVRPGEGPTAEGHDVYVRITDSPVHRTHDYPDGPTGDYAADGTLIGMKVSGATAVTIDGVAAVPAGTGEAMAAPPAVERAAEVMGQHSIDPTRTDADRNDYCVCGGWISDAAPAGTGGAATPDDDVVQSWRHELRRLRVERDMARAEVQRLRALWPTNGFGEDTNVRQLIANHRAWTEAAEARAAALSSMLRGMARRAVSQRRLHRWRFGALTDAVAAMKAARSAADLAHSTVDRLAGQVAAVRALADDLDRDAQAAAGLWSAAVSRAGSRIRAVLDGPAETGETGETERHSCDHCETCTVCQEMNDPDAWGDATVDPDAFGSAGYLLRAASATHDLGADDDMFSTACADCGEAITDDRPSAGESHEGPLHEGCGEPCVCDTAFTCLAHDHDDEQDRAADPVPSVPPKQSQSLTCGCGRVLPCRHCPDRDPCREQAAMTGISCGVGDKGHALPHRGWHRHESDTSGEWAVYIEWPAPHRPDFAARPAVADTETEET